MTAFAPSVVPGPGRTVAAPTWSARVLEWAVEARSHRVILLVLGIWLLNAFDLAFTVLAFQQGMLHEENPVARYMLSHGISSIMLFKIGLVLVGSYPLLRFRTARVTELGSMVILIAYAMLAMHWSECVELYSITISQGANIAELAQLNGFAP
jgi:hypothetical protein